MIEDDKPAIEDDKPMTRWPVRIAALVIIAVAAFFAWESSRLPYYTAVGPGSGFFPLWLAVGLGALALVVLVQSFRVSDEIAVEDIYPGPTGVFRILATVVLLGLYVVFLTPLGFRITTFVFCLTLLFVYGRPKIWVALAVSLATSVIIHHALVNWLQVYLPPGPWGI